MPVQVQPNGRMQFIRNSKTKTKSGHSHDSRDQKMADLKSKVRELKEQKDQLYDRYIDINDLRKQAVDECNVLKQAYVKSKHEGEEMENKYNVLEGRYESLHERYERRGEEIKLKDKIIRQRDSDVRQKDKEIKELEELRVDKRFLNGTIKKVEDQNAGLLATLTKLKEENRKLDQEASLRKANEEKQRVEIKKLKEENARLVDWMARERQQALDKESRQRREEAERRDDDRRQQRRRFDDDIPDDPRFTRPMPSRPRHRWESD